ncbi:MAG: metallophosphoesterase [Hydrogenophaga sp.]|nr:metallophosphoesterase [Hydrogenophaga sp.]
MRIAHISDLHIIATPEAPGILRADTVARAHALMADLSAFPGLDLVVITGDTVNDARAEEYAVLAEVLAGLTVPFLILPGNHDDRAALRALVPDQPYADGQMLYHQWQQDHVRVFVLDTLWPGQIGGRLQTAQLDWLEQNLAQPFDGQTLIALHHPPCAPAMGRLDGNILIEGVAALRSLLDRQQGPVTVLCGHLHRPFTGRFGRSVVELCMNLGDGN